MQRKAIAKYLCPSHVVKTLWIHAVTKSWLRLEGSLYLTAKCTWNLELRQMKVTWGHSPADFTLADAFLTIRTHIASSSLNRSAQPYLQTYSDWTSLSFSWRTCVFQHLYLLIFSQPPHILDRYWCVWERIHFTIQFMHRMKEKLPIKTSQANSYFWRPLELYQKDIAQILSLISKQKYFKQKHGEYGLWWRGCSLVEHMLGIQMPPGSDLGISS